MEALARFNEEEPKADQEMKEEPTVAEEMMMEHTGVGMDEVPSGMAKRSSLIGGLGVNIASRMITVMAISSAVLFGPVYGAISGGFLDPDMIAQSDRESESSWRSFMCSTV